MTATLVEHVEAVQTEPVDDPLKIVAAAMRSTAESIQSGMGRAAAKVQGAVPARTRFVSRFVYSSCYFLSYGVVFPTIFVANFLPGFGPIAEGLEEGARNAIDAIAEIKEQAIARCDARQSVVNHPASAI